MYVVASMACQRIGVVPLYGKQCPRGGYKPTRLAVAKLPATSRPSTVHGVFGQNNKRQSTVTMPRKRNSHIKARKADVESLEKLLIIDRCDFCRRDDDGVSQ